MLLGESTIKWYDEWYIDGYIRTLCYGSRLNYLDPMVPIVHEGIVEKRAE